MSKVIKKFCPKIDRKLSEIDSQSKMRPMPIATEPERNKDTKKVTDVQSDRNCKKNDRCHQFFYQNCPKLADRCSKWTKMSRDITAKRGVWRQIR